MVSNGYAHLDSYSYPHLDSYSYPHLDAYRHALLDAYRNSFLDAYGYANDHANNNSHGHIDDLYLDHYPYPVSLLGNPDPNPYLDTVL